jgi:DNA-binding transcriptional ArsR family regulator
MARSNKGKEGETRSKKASQLLDRLKEWPESWAIDDEKDIRTGEEITAVLREFAQSLVDAGLAPSTISRHLSNLWLLGGEIISDINYDPPLRRKQAVSLLESFVDETGGPYTRHLDTDEERRSFDATCKKLYKYLRRKAGIIGVNNWSCRAKK